MSLARDVMTQAWRTAIPAPGDTHGPLSPLLLILTIVTGLVDAFSYLVLGHVFVANMTGNVVFLAFALAGARGFSVAASLLALGAFSLGALTGGRLITRLPRHRGRLLLAASTVEVVLTAAALVVTEVERSPGSGSGRFVLIGLLGAAMGTQNAAARKIAVPDLTTTVLTLTITGVSADARVVGGTGSRAGRRLLSAISMFVGALVGAVLVVGSESADSVAVALLLLVVVAAITAKVSRGDSDWARPGGAAAGDGPPSQGKGRP